MMVEPIDVERGKVVRTKVGAGHANEADKEQKVLDHTYFRHGMTTVGFKPRDPKVSIGEYRYRHINPLILASSPLTLALALGLGSRPNESVSLIHGPVTHR
eukprot:3685955-Heterocapsa_arctica.AAC.1